MDIPALTRSLRLLCRPSTLGYMCKWQVLRRNLYIALVVGFVLSIINQLDIVLRGPITTFLVIKLASNFVIPFIVSSVSVALDVIPRGSVDSPRTAA